MYCQKMLMPLMYILGDYWLGLEPMYHMVNQKTGNGPIKYGLEIDMWTTQGEHFIARYCEPRKHSNRSVIFIKYITNYGLKR